MTPQTPILHNVVSAVETATAGVYLLKVDVTDAFGDRDQTATFVSSPDDPHGLAPIVRQWLTDNPEFAITPYVEPMPPTTEEIRAKMPAITPRQFWIAAASIGVSKQDVLDVVATMQDEAEKIRTQIEILEATTYERTNPYIDDLSGILGITGEQLDALWMWASAV